MVEMLVSGNRQLLLCCVMKVRASDGGGGEVQWLVVSEAVLSVGVLGELEVVVDGRDRGTNVFILEADVRGGGR